MVNPKTSLLYTTVVQYKDGIEDIHQPLDIYNGKGRTLYLLTLLEVSPSS